jgi:hypothetical protein
MLPGFRFLLAAIVLSVSIVTFGLGAAALLRAAHEEFASIPARRVTPEPYFAQPAETPPPTLAMLRVEPALQSNAAVTPSAPVLAEEPAPEAVPVPMVHMEKLAALNADVAPPAEPAKPELAATEPAVAAPLAAETQAETKMAALDTPPAPVSAPVVENAPVPSERIVMPAAMTQIVTPAKTDGSRGATSDKPAAKIAALGSPAASVAAEAETKKSNAKAERSEARKKQRADRAKERRRLAARRAQLAAQQAAAAQTTAIQQPADLFGEATPQTQQQTQPATRRR